METSVAFADGTATISVSGSLNTNTASELESVLNTAFESASSVTFDFAHLDYISSAGLRVLMVAYKKADALGGSIQIVGASDEVRDVFEVTGFSDIFDIS